MKVAFPTNEGEKIARHVSFCDSFLIIDTRTGESEMLDNPLKTEVATDDVEKDKSGGRHLGSGPIISALLADVGVDIYAYLEAEANFLAHLQREGIDIYETQEKVIETALEVIEARGNKIPKSRFFDLGLGRGMGRGMGKGFGRRAGKGRGFGRGNGRGFQNR